MILSLLKTPLIIAIGMNL
uniref:Uncharacterized protein n=1 Tax=Anguilla anguilla TaxID=7936 RepID=A0A0E9QEA5_ANGAN